MTTMNETTPGPWVWFEDALYEEKVVLAKLAARGADNYEDASIWQSPIVETDSGHYGPKGKDRPLIAAAPTMYAALEAAEKYLATVCDPFKTGVGDALVTVRAALAAAAGRDAEAKP